MQYHELGRTGIRVSAICLGTMTWGQQNTEAEAHAQLDRALEVGVNFIDTAEMYPVPARAQTQGRTEQYIGSWLKKRGRRDDVVLATKVVGRSAMDWFRGPGGTCLDRRNIERALHESLRRLGTDYIDLYQLHWPDRPTNFFGRLGYTHQPDQQAVPIAETLGVLADLVEAGKVRSVGVSNETPWGAMKFLALSQHRGLPRIASIQNPYNLLNRTFEIGLAEVAHREDAGLLAYSPLAFGTLTGKYLHGARPAGARLSLWDHYNRYTTTRGQQAAERYVALAREHGLDPAQMALAYVNNRPFLTATILGATAMDQLEADLASIDLSLSEEVQQGIEAIHQQTPNPCP